MRAILVDYSVETKYKKGTDITCYLTSKIFPIKKIDAEEGTQLEAKEEVGDVKKIQSEEDVTWRVAGEAPHCGIDPLNDGTGEDGTRNAANTIRTCSRDKPAHRY